MTFIHPWQSKTASQVSLFTDSFFVCFSHLKFQQKLRKKADKKHQLLLIHLMHKLGDPLHVQQLFQLFEDMGILKDSAEVEDYEAYRIKFKKIFRRQITDTITKGYSNQIDRHVNLSDLLSSLVFLL